MWNWFSILELAHWTHLVSSFRLTYCPVSTSGKIVQEVQVKLSSLSPWQPLLSQTYTVYHYLTLSHAKYTHTLTMFNSKSLDLPYIGMCGISHLISCYICIYILSIKHFHMHHKGRMHTCKQRLSRHYVGMYISKVVFMSSLHAWMLWCIWIPSHKHSEGHWGVLKQAGQYLWLICNVQ